MTPEQEAKTFFFEGNPVGYFCEDRLPNTPGQYRYTPYRGVGHYNLGRALGSNGPQRCQFRIGGKSAEFVVQSIPAYGTLEITTIEN